MQGPGRLSTSAIAVCVIAAGLAVAAESKRYDPADFPTFELTPEVKRVFADGGHRARMAYNYLRYASALMAGGDSLDAVVSPDIILNDLRPMGFTGLAGLKEFRRQRNAAMTYDRALLLRIDVPENDITDVNLCTERTDPATGAKSVLLIHARDRWASDRVVERWHQLTPQASVGSCDNVTSVSTTDRKP